MSQARLRADYQTMAKPRAVEEPADIYLIRPLGFLLVGLFRRTPLTPTAVSVLAMVAGWWSAWYYFESQRGGMIPGFAALGAVALLLHSALDSADGQLARLKRMHTSLGRIIDGLCDNLVFLAIYLAIVVGYWYRSPEHHLAVLVLAALAIAAHSVQASLVEYQRSLYLQTVHRSGDLAASKPELLKDSESPGLVVTVIRGLHRAYYRQQRLFLASTGRLEEWLEEWQQRHPQLAGELALRYERSHRSLLPWWAWLAPNSHKAGLVVASFLPVGSGSFWASLGLGWYLVYTVALSLLVPVLVRAQRTRNRRLEVELGALEPPQSASAGEAWVTPRP